jgi:predicted transcriptional regulator
MTGPSRGAAEESRAFRETLVRRERVLRMLADGPLDQRDLRDALGVSRSTAYKSLRELEERGLVRSAGDGTYQLTQYGSLVHRRHDEYAASVDRIRAARAVLDSLPDDLLLPLAFVERGHAVVASEHAPERPLDRLDAESSRSHDYRALSPIAVPRFLPGIHERVENGDLVAELLVEPGAVAYLREYDRLDEALATDGFDLLRADEPIEIGLLLSDDRKRASLFAYGSQGGVIGMLVSEAPEAYRWADRTYQRYRETATPVEPRS